MTTRTAGAVKDLSTSCPSGASDHSRYRSGRCVPSARWSLDFRRQSLWSRKAVAVGDELGDLGPVDLTHVQAKSDPALGTDVIRRVEAVGFHGKKRGALAGQ